MEGREKRKKPEVFDLSKWEEEVEEKKEEKERKIHPFFTKKKEQKTVQSVPSHSPSSSPKKPKASDSREPNQNETKPVVNQPLAERVRPISYEQFVGQEQVVQLLSKFGSTDIQGGKPYVPSVILWGPPGSGKTTLARILGKKVPNSSFVQLSAVDTGLSKVREIVEKASNAKKLSATFQTVLFVDEIHRFNKLQQDSFLPCIENGTIILIGATTENPSFECNSALLSRCKVFILKKLSNENLSQILNRAMEFHNQSESIPIAVEDGVIDKLASIADGDARFALNLLEISMEIAKANGISEEITYALNSKDINQVLQRSHLLYDKKGDQHHHIISALHKSMRGGDVDASLYWMGRMLEGGEEPLYIARRLIRFASEDIGLADPQALIQANAAYQATHSIGKPECDVVLAQCVAYLALAPKSNALYTAYSAVRECIESEPNAPVPLHICNAPTKLMRDFGFGQGYKYNPDYEGQEINQTYLPDSLLGRKFFHWNPKS
eukprot:TRINITY_DN7160_c0_g1_i2.p1 TRINITY_DN7160_c0_g1~~TRINITY_DN7160_c0_g1_i2.p1  ORF type:complete len:496 (+),score=181.73 TRINITY_DN7160_c0_g1_i2:85-1572(+)